MIYTVLFYILHIQKSNILLLLNHQWIEWKKKKNPMELITWENAIVKNLFLGCH